MTNIESQRSDANLCRHLVDAAAETPELLAVAVQRSKRAFPFSTTHKFTYHELSFSQLNEHSDRIAYSLNRYGIKQGMKAVLMVTPSIEFFTLTFALFKAGIIPIFVDPGMGVKNLKQCFIEAAPDAFIGIPKAHLARRLFGWGRGSITHLVTVGGTSLWGGSNLQELVSSTDKNTKPYPMVTLHQDDMAAILFTSGSTGTPKGVVYSHRMFEAQIRALKHDYHIKSGERDLATFPLFALFGPALGMASIVPDMDASRPITAKPENLFAAIEQYQCTNMFVNPALIERLGLAAESHKEGQFKLPMLQRVISAGAPATISSIKRFSQMLTDGVAVLNSYGATESLPISKIASDELFSTTDITDSGGGICVGRAIEGVEIEIIEITENCIEEWGDHLVLPPNSVGEIVVKGAMVSQQYFNREQATLLAKITDSGSIRHRMGDLGYIDDLGRLWMCGRKTHRVDLFVDDNLHKRYLSIPCERIFNTHPLVKRSALVGVNIHGVYSPLICIELVNNTSDKNISVLFDELENIASQHKQTEGITHFMIHPDFPVDIRHNAKIFREKLALWAQKRVGS